MMFSKANFNMHTQVVDIRVSLSIDMASIHVQYYLNLSIIMTIFLIDHILRRFPSLVTQAQKSCRCLMTREQQPIPKARDL